MGEWITGELTGALQTQAQSWIEANGFTLLLWVAAGIVALVILAKFGRWIAGAVVVMIIGAVLVMSSYGSATQATATSAVATAAARGGFGTGSTIIATVLVTLLCVVGGWGAWQYRQRQKAKPQAGGISLPGLGQIDPNALLSLLVTQMLQGQRGSVQAPPPSVVVVNGPAQTGQRQGNAQGWEAWEVEQRQPALTGDQEEGGFTWGE